jgi:hypothetical protein
MKRADFFLHGDTRGGLEFRRVVFWEHAYVAALTGGSNILTALAIADRSVFHRFGLEVEE